ncbi:signal peptidase I [Paenibacillus thailandensis]|uniref:Signal peptidase I n=1 Tax=Paenibacillus thailandensis TaxID=393250 RepID=A0ABW5R1U0_9BACL
MEESKTGCRGSRRRIALEWVAAVAAAMVIAFLVHRYAYAQLEVHNVSMQNTLSSGQRLIEDRWSYRFVQPKRGDIVIINGPESKLRLIKRVVALPGERLDIRDGQVWIDGSLLHEPYAVGRTEPGDGLPVPYTVETGKLVVLGDNRENSMDSRTIGPIAMTSIEGKAVLRIYPIDQFGTLR